MKAQEAKDRAAKSVAVAPVPAVISSSPCLIVKQNKGHRVRNAFLFGVSGLCSARANDLNMVESFNLANSKMKYKGGELQKLKDSGLHIIVVSENAGDEVQTARASCQTGSNVPALAKAGK